MCKVDSRGSVLFSAKPDNPLENISVLEYSMHAPLVPLTMASLASYEPVENDPSLGSLGFEVTLTNISTDCEVKDVVVVVYVPAYDRLESFDFDCSKGSKGKVVYNAPTRSITIRIPKLKPGVSCKIDMLLKVRSTPRHCFMA